MIPSELMKTDNYLIAYFIYIVYFMHCIIVTIVINGG